MLLEFSHVQVHLNFLKFVLILSGVYFIQVLKVFIQNDKEFKKQSHNIERSTGSSSYSFIHLRNYKLKICEPYFKIWIL